MILFLLAGCLGGESYAPGYAYPSFEKTRVRQYCTALYFPPYVEYIAPSRKRKVTSIESRTHGLLAVFADGRSYRVPLQTDLPAGQVFYCNYRSDPCPVPRIMTGTHAVSKIVPTVRGCSVTEITPGLNA